MSMIERIIKRNIHKTDFPTISKDQKSRFEEDISVYNSLLLENDKRFVINEKNNLPMYDDTEGAGSVDSHYFLQDYYMAKKVIESGVKEHFDIGSRIDGFIMHLLASNVSCTLLDIRPFPIEVDGLNFIQTDATSLSNIEENSITSISSLHAIEHFGLGRYGDPIDPYSWEKALQSIQSKLKRNGVFYLGLPVGNKDRLQFNAHRVFRPLTIIETLNNLKLISFSYIHENKIYDVNIEDKKNIERSIGNYDCGLFIFTKE